MNRWFFLFLSFFIVNGIVDGQDEKVVAAIFSEALGDHTAYENLRVLCKDHRGRITGSPEAAAAVEYLYGVMAGMGLDTLYKQPVDVPVWKRGKKETAGLVSRKTGKISFPVAALGMSVPTGKSGLSGRVLEVKDFDELARKGKEVRGKIIFFNQPMNPALYSTFTAYGQAAGQRIRGASEAAKYGAAGVVIRSLTTAVDDDPHTGIVVYDEALPKIPAVAISTKGANRLSDCLKIDPDLVFHFRTDCSRGGEVKSANVIGQITGSRYPEEIITVGGHLDAWDLGEGAHDDGAGCVQSVEVLRLFIKLGIRPKRSLRAVMFMDEEVAQKGGKAYAAAAESNGEKHYFAIESDRGGFSPLGFGISAPPGRLEKMQKLTEFLSPYGIQWINEGGGGVDIGPLGKFGTPLAAIIPDQQRYFDYHHSAGDVFEQVNIRELQLGSAALAALIYLIDKYDL